jgi:hypothetical protein
MIAAQTSTAAKRAIIFELMARGLRAATAFDFIPLVSFEADFKKFAGRDLRALPRAPALMRFNEAMMGSASALQCGYRRDFCWEYE